MKLKTSIVAVALLLPMAAQAYELKIVNGDGEVLQSLSQVEIEAMGTEKLETVTPWTEGNNVFEGVPLAKLIAAQDGGGDVTVVSMDDYVAEIPRARLDRHDPLVATRMNGEPLTLENKGPFWIMFDFDGADSASHPELRTMAVWHLMEIEVR